MDNCFCFTPRRVTGKDDNTKPNIPASENVILKAAAEVVCDYIANMTDIMAIEEHRKLFDPVTRF